MSDIGRLKGTKCYDDGCDSSGNLDIKSCIDSTGKQCTLGTDETGSQKVAIENAKRHAVEVDVSLESQNSAVEYDPRGDSLPECEVSATVGPSSMGSVGRFPFSVEIEQSRQSRIIQVSEETLAVTTEYEYHNSSRGTRTGPDAHPKVELK